MADNHELKKRKFCEAFENNLGNVSDACKFAVIDRQTYYDWKKKDSEFKKAIDEIQEGLGDFVESKLLGRIKSQDTTAMIFYCKTKLKHRGYVEKTEVQHSGDANNPISAEIKTVQVSVEDFKQARKDILDEV